MILNFRVPHSERSFPGSPKRSRVLGWMRRVRILRLSVIFARLDTNRNPLERRYGERHLHFITCSCYGRRPLLGSAKNRDIFLEEFDAVRNHRKFLLVGYVVMPEHVHLLFSEPDVGTPSTIMQLLKQNVSRRIAARKGESFWQRRFYDFNVWSRKKIFEKLHYMHMNPVTRRLVDDPGNWRWSSYRYYQFGEAGRCTPDREPS